MHTQLGHYLLQGSTLRPACLPGAGKKNSGQVKVPGHLPCRAGGFEKLTSNPDRV